MTLTMSGVEPPASCFVFHEDSTTISGWLANDPEDSCYTKYLIIPSHINGHEVRRIESNVFSSKELKVVIIPETVTYISSMAFSFNKLEALYINNKDMEFSNSTFFCNPTLLDKNIYYEGPKQPSVIYRGCENINE